MLNNNNRAQQPLRRSVFSGFLSLALLVFSPLLAGPALADNAQLKPPHLESGGAWVYSVESEFDDVKDSLVEAIEAQGMVISYVSHAESMLARTAASIGGKVVYSDAEVLLFCKANLAHRLVAANPHNLVLCPYAMSVYGLVDKPGRIYVGIRSPQTTVGEYQAVHDLLTGVIAEALAEQ